MQKKGYRASTTHQRQTGIKGGWPRERQPRRYWAGPGRPSKSRFEFLRLQESTWTHGPPTVFYPPTTPGDFCHGRIIRNALWGAPRASQEGDSLQNRLVVNLEFCRVHFWALWYLRSTAFSPGSLLRFLSRHFPPNRAIEVAFLLCPRWEPTKKPRAEHTAETPPHSVDTRRGRFDGTDQRRKARPFTSFNPCSKRLSNHCAGGPAVRPSHDATSTSTQKLLINPPLYIFF